MRQHVSTWQLQIAKQRFSEVVRKAECEGPQQITKGGIESAWLISAKDYRRLTKKKQSLVEFFQNSPHTDVEICVERRKDRPRKVVL